MNTGPGRKVEEWTDEELSLLESLYCLEGSGLIARLTGRTADSIRQKATRLQLRAEMKDYTLASEVRQQAGVDESAVRKWIDRHHYRPHCRTWGRQLLMPAPMVRLYLHETRADARPPGTWGRARTADHLGCAISRIPTTLSYRTVGRTRFYDPQEVTMHRTPAPPRTMIRLRDIHPHTGPTWRRAVEWLQDAGHRIETYPRQVRGKPAHYINETAARHFLSARGHREEMVDTLLRKAQGMDASKVKETK